MPKCRHAFHTECILPWLTERQGCCPLCKIPVESSLSSSTKRDDDDDLLQSSDEESATTEDHVDSFNDSDSPPELDAISDDDESHASHSV